MAKRKSISKKTRFEVFKRDSFTCQYCGKSAPDIVLEVDHIIPVSKGGTNDISNLITSCFDCNRGKKDRKLTDDQTIKKQKEELDKLNERRNQLEMMAQWKAELLDLENEEADRLFKLVSDSLNLNKELTDSGRKDMKKLIKKYGFEEILECSLIAYEKYDTSIAFKKISGIANNRKMQSENSEMKDVFYIRAIARNRFSYINEQEAIILLKECFKYGLSADDMKDFTIKCKNWTEWKNGIQIFIEREQEKERKTESYEDELDFVCDILDTHQLEAKVNQTIETFSRTLINIVQDFKLRDEEEESLLRYINDGIKEEIDNYIWDMGKRGRKR